MGTVDSIYLLELARDHSPSGRRRLGQALSDVFSDRIANLTEREHALMFDILRRVIHDMEMNVREIISRELAKLPAAPRDLCRALANDEIEVAFPILAHCNVLHDEDLVEIIFDRAFEHQLAVSVRQSVSEQVCDALVDAGHREVIASLLRNNGARISQATLEYLVEESQRIDSFHEPILHRDDLEPELAKRMYMWVSAALRQFILERFDFDGTAMDDLLEATAIRQSAWEKPPRKSQTKSEVLAEELARQQELGPEILIESLKVGEISLFMSLFEQFTGLPPGIVRRILYDATGEGLIIACKATGLDGEAFWTIRSLLRKVRPTIDETDPPARESVLNRYAEMNEAAAKATTRAWRRDEDYLIAIRQLQQVQHANG